MDVHSMQLPIWPGMAPEDLIDHAEERMRVYRHMGPFIHTCDGFEDDSVKIMAWATIMSCPMSKLHFYLKEGNIHKSDVLIFRLSIVRSVTTLCKTFLCRPPPPTNKYDPTWSFTVPASHRGVSEPEKCLIRDGNKCVVTGSPSPAVRHIFAPAAENWKPVTTAFHALFECRHHSRLVKRLFRDSPDRANNLIAMSGHLHALWAKGLIGLQPMGLSPDGKTLTVAIRFMLRSRSNCPKDPDASLVELVRPADRRMTASIVDVETGRKVRDGQIITFRQATVPESGEIIPVPNWDILQLQWMLVKAISLAGAATPFLDVEDGDDDGTGYGVHESFLEMQDHEDLDIEELRGVVYEVIDHDVYYSDDGQLPLNPKSPRTWSLHPSAGQ